MDVWTDGSCINNGKRGAIAGCGIYFGPDDPRNTSCTCPGKQTNQRAELFAILVALRMTTEPLHIFTDSLYSIKCVTGIWHPKQNLDIINEILFRLKQRQVEFTHVRGHRDNVGNIAADKLAREASEKKL